MNLHILLFLALVVVITKIYLCIHSKFTSMKACWLHQDKNLEKEAMYLLVWELVKLNYLFLPAELYDILIKYELYAELC